jgi:ABC-2 type transport system ATP-binding protein
MIQARGLQKTYGKFTAVDSIDLFVQPGEIYGFLGPNGAGKTTTILMLLGIIRPTRGEVFLFNEKYNPERIDLRKKIGVVPEKHPQGSWKWMTVYEYLHFFADLFWLKAPKDRIRYLLKYVNLLEVENKRIKGLSRGMLQKLSIVRALLHDPDILFLDEPISGLDPIGIKQVRDLILTENREGRTIFISSHSLSEMEKICHSVGIIFKGRLIAEDKMTEILLKLSKNREIIIDLERIPAEFSEALKKLPFVLDAKVSESTIKVKVPKEGDYRKEISEFIIQKNLIPLKIEEKTFSLEEAFVTITRDNVGMLAAAGGVM